MNKETLELLITNLLGYTKSLETVLEFLNIEDQYSLEFVEDLLLDNGIEQCYECGVWFDNCNGLDRYGNKVCEDCYADKKDIYIPSDFYKYFNFQIH